MEIVMGQMDYGKSDIRLVRVDRPGPRHQLKDVRVRVLLEGALERGYVRGENTGWMSTDTIRNRVYALAATELDTSIEAFGVALARHFAEVAPQAQTVAVSLNERLWSRLPSAGGEHDHAFIRDAGVRTAEVHGDGTSFEIAAGIGELTILKTTASGWQGYLKDPFTTLPETDDRILATEITARWDYRPGELSLDFDGVWERVREQLLVTFGDHYSPGAQHDVYLMGRAVLERFEQIERIRISLPNNHHLVYDLERFGIANDRRIYHASGDPRGLIEGTVERHGR
jgi:urate oxidase